ncbi:polysaccharide pyruvyl transferase CsaB [Wukongibacter sp. M2B1]|uniref:polysaccharide pyruvyl transferase CsaB n=1 Tax=Wukongibacter sp. M2B1 TaxID=3088895 RepID=UPI003D7B361E
MKRVFIFGYYGFKNLGDEAILSSLVKMIREQDSTTEICALSYNTKYTENIHKINGVSRNSFRDILSAIKNSDLVISGGGSLLQDVTSSRSLLYYLTIISIAKFFKKSVLFFCNGFGPIRNKHNRYLAKTIINKVDRIVLRDPKSKKLMEEIGVTKQIEVTIDSTFSLEGIDKKKAMDILQNECIPTDKPLVGISVRPWYIDESFIKTMTSLADYIASKGLSVVFVPMQVSKDDEISRKIMDGMKNESYILKKEYPPEEILGIIGTLDIMIAMRLHALIFSCIKKIPMIGLEYDPKVQTFLQMVEQKNGGKVEQLDYINLCIEFDNLWDRRYDESKKLGEINEKLQEMIKRNRDILSRML